MRNAKYRMRKTEGKVPHILQSRPDLPLPLPLPVSQRIFFQAKAAKTIQGMPTMVEKTKGHVSTTKPPDRVVRNIVSFLHHLL